ncbi:hypothetical protein RRG08_009727 [Elysia crispata]|uniref:Uncharacterized protein n=1 Tax=Elysia crispata TaxID=231223 RepID=A0AAE0Y8D8_9GAST|nr:hypothetical protein RRG08_009727 [Elysia crispata]
MTFSKKYWLKTMAEDEGQVLILRYTGSQRLSLGKSDDIARADIAHKRLRLPFFTGRLLLVPPYFRVIVHGEFTRSEDMETLQTLSVSFDI